MSEPSPVLDAFSPGYFDDPYPVFRRMREESPAWFSEDLGVWVISRYEDVRRVLGDHETFANALTLTPVAPVCEHAGRLLSGVSAAPVTVAGDGADHARVRDALMATFPVTRERSAELAPAMRANADRLINLIIPAGNADLVADFARPLSARVILTLLGVPPEDFERLDRWSEGQIELVWGSASEDQQVGLAADLVELWRYCRGFVSAREHTPGDDLVTRLWAYRGGDDDVLNEREIASIAFNMLLAGHEASVNLLANAVFQLLSSNRWHELVHEPERIPAIVEEMLRYDPPIVGWLRSTVRPAEIAGAHIAQGERVLLMLGSAGRDEQRYATGDRLELDRPAADELLAFGHGRHFCPGAEVARLEAQVAVERLAARLPGLRTWDRFEPEYAANLAFRAMLSLPVTWGA